MIYSAGGDLFNQAPNANKMARSLDGVELIVAQDHFLTPTARHADIVLPATTFWERNDVHTPWAGAGHYAIYMKQAIEPMYECRNDMAIFADLAARLGINDYDDRTEEQWLRELTRGAVGDFEAFRENGVARFAPPKDAVAFAAQIRDPDTHKFTTPSGRIEIYSMAMAAKPDPYGLGAMPPIPTWFEPVEPDAKYPLMLCSPKSRARTHSIHGNQPLLARVDPDDVWMNPADARARGITDGQTVRIFNDRGSTAAAGQGHAAHRARRGLDQGGGVVHAGCGRKLTPRDVLTCWRRIGRRPAGRRLTIQISSRSRLPRSGRPCRSLP